MDYNEWMSQDKHHPSGETSGAGNRKSNRWYDQRPQISVSVQLLEAFPREIQTIIAQGVNDIADREFKANELAHTFRSLGSEKVMALYKSKNKQRKQDQNPSFHQIMTYLTLLSEENQELVAGHVIQLVGHVRDYLVLCQSYEQEPRSQQLSELQNTYVNYGSTRTRELVETVKQQFVLTAGGSPRAPQPETPPAEKTFSETYRDDGGEMKITAR